MTRRFLGSSLALALLALSPALLAQQQELPRFRSSVELTSIDVSVADDKGVPIVDLTPEDFSVRVDGADRRVVSAQWIPLEVPAEDAPPPPEGYSSNQGGTGGRLILIVIDQPNIRFGGTFGIRGAVNAFIDHLQPSDRAAIIGIGPGAFSTSFTNDRARLKKAVERMSGLHQQSMMLWHSIGAGEAMDIRQGSSMTLRNVVDRECRDMGGRPLAGPDLDICQTEVEQQAMQMALDSALDGRQTIDALRALLTGLKSIDAPKTMILVSEGFMTDGQITTVSEVGALAAAARTSIFALKLDDELFSMTAESAGPPISRMNDRAARAEGLGILADASRGSMFNVIGTGAGIFERIQSELSGYYLLGVESGTTDRDGKLHPLRVEVTRKGAKVRARRALLEPPPDTRPRSAQAAVAAALSTPLPVSALPLRIATFSLQGPEADKVQLLIHADIGTDYASSRAVALAYIITNESGQVVDTQIANARLPPIMTGVPSALQFSGGANLPPGDYFLKMAVAEGDRVGTVEHTIHATIAQAGAVRVSDLMVGGPINYGNDPLQPTVGYDVFFGAVHAYVEAYGKDIADLKAQYEIASTADGPALLQAEVPPRPAGDSRAIFTRIMPVRQLPPGKYVLRATLSSAGKTVKTSLRSFEVAAPAVLMTSAASPAAAMMPPSELYLPVTEAMLSRAFNSSDAAQPDTVQAFRARVAPARQAAFDKGIQALSTGAYRDAEISFKSAVDPLVDSSAVLAYLAVTFAASGHDTEAAGAWQTALIDSSDLPQIYDWLAGALMRSHDLAMARSTLEEAIEEWPMDPRFTKPLALVYATLGQGREAVRTLERYLSDAHDDVEAYFMGVEWIYQLNSQRAVAHSPVEDVRLARRYADAYTNLKGPQTALIKQWMDFLEKKK